MVTYAGSSIAHLREVFGTPDPHRGRNSRYEMADICMAAFSMFFKQQLSFSAFLRSLYGRFDLHPGHCRQEYGQAASRVRIALWARMSWGGLAPASAGYILHKMSS